LAAGLLFFPTELFYNFEVDKLGFVLLYIVLDLVILTDIYDKVRATFYLMGCEFGSTPLLFTLYRLSFLKNLSSEPLVTP
jgi:hypothetical protein